MEEKNTILVQIVTGMSGAGKSVVMDVLEDIGYYCIDNLPPQLIGQFISICRESENHLQKIAIAVDLRSGEMFADTYHVLSELKEKSDYTVKILYMEATDEVLVQRYQETRRRHPLETTRGSLHEAINFEREKLLPIREIADYDIETSDTSVATLKTQIRDIFLAGESDALAIKVTSFGFKYGVSTESDLVFDVRCLPNPHYIPELRAHTGCEACVQEYVMQYEQSRELLAKIEDLLDFLIPLYVGEGKSRLVIAFGCTGGRHRSITFAEKVGAYLKEKGVGIVTIQHRDIGKQG